ncbi:MAG: 3-dehydroquinate synthase [Zymomonas mobilis subsp. pomaceae]|uniref:3-dehydroquinate synthase n=1 Tax=Zymomonas mobilis subsp. pomaceae (strain ATCC 29192 / DSM 22645 / JCM 10191 / CCUG 17912 / NBRC 13757 / NCIMB 11200 / NRRL B-4491 / Barker I) TaxID=579138 RepID=F8ERS0_ZYMMT|nr:3-dehydroquinate synthase [Zymomonas mobilis]AEI37528.1 3-dehydroquinate synthase [Zymomonas mobilis subsp. pomaceae ATCC 29192]MDX5948896.1 3-dehydroquinate synthase [Zymomonas mobilis subsp. pomaceae]GEB88702.1 3-dehydroquinate synthase [Zymomonas mobilis subsp. pomaceae]
MMKETLDITSVPIDLGSHSYKIDIGAGLFQSAGSILQPYTRQNRLVVITDENVARCQLPELEKALNNADITVDAIILPAGESTKSWHHLAELCDQLIRRGIERRDAIVALGGGVIGDLVGFAAAILKRGCRFIQIPTSLLAQVDSSVGGKTAINCEAGKNLIGAFHQPVFVLIDPNALDTLPIRQVRAGYGEVIKYGLIDDAAFFEWCEQYGTDLISGDKAARHYAIEHSIRAKAAIVAEDEKELSGKRALLNLGHTFGHALEADTGFSEKLFHGEAVAAGSALAFGFSAVKNLAPKEDAARVIHHLRVMGLPASLEEAGVKASGKELVAHMMHDKKMEGGQLPFLLVQGIGQTFLDRHVNLDEVARFLDSDIARRGEI